VPGGLLPSAGDQHQDALCRVWIPGAVGMPGNRMPSAWGGGSPVPGCPVGMPGNGMPGARIPVPSGVARCPGAMPGARYPCPVGLPGAGMPGGDAR